MATIIQYTDAPVELLTQTPDIEVTADEITIRTFSNTGQATNTKFAIDELAFLANWMQGQIASTGCKDEHKTLLDAWMIAAPDIWDTVTIENMKIAMVGMSPLEMITLIFACPTNIVTLIDVCRRKTMSYLSELYRAGSIDCQYAPTPRQDEEHEEGEIVDELEINGSAPFEDVKRTTSSIISLLILMVYYCKAIRSENISSIGPNVVPSGKHRRSVLTWEALAAHLETENFEFCTRFRTLHPNLSIMDSRQALYFDKLKEFHQDFYNSVQGVLYAARLATVPVPTRLHILEVKAGLEKLNDERLKDSINLVHTFGRAVEGIGM